MEPNKIEKHIQEKFREREITPSELAWDSITKELDSVEKSSGKGFYWYGIAASVLVLIAFSLFFFKGKDTVPAKAVVNQNPGKNTLNRVKSEDFNNVLLDTVKETVATVDLMKNQGGNIKVREQVSIVAAQNNAIKLLEGIDTITLKTDSLRTIEKTFINAKILEVVAHVDSLEMNNILITDAEVDALLRNAQNDIIRNSSQLENGKIDAMALLTDVEDELDQTFREQIFMSLKSKFLRARTAVADRHQ